MGRNLVGLVWSVVFVGEVNIVLILIDRFFVNPHLNHKVIKPWLGLTNMGFQHNKSTIQTQHQKYFGTQILQIVWVFLEQVSIVMVSFGRSISVLAKFVFETLSKLEWKCWVQYCFWAIRDSFNFQPYLKHESKIMCETSRECKHFVKY